MTPKQLWEEFQIISHFCRENTLLRRVDIQTIKSTKGELRHHIWRNGTMKAGRNIVAINNNFDLLEVSSLKPRFDEKTKIIFMNATKPKGRCSIFNVDGCDVENSQPLTLIARNFEGISGNLTTVFSKIDMKVIDYMEIGDFSLDFLPHFSQLNLTICQISLTLHGPGMYSRSVLQRRFFNLWWKVIQEGRFISLMATNEKRTALLLNIKTPYCLQNYVEPFFNQKKQ